MSSVPPRVLVTGWPSFLDGEATAGDVLAMDATGAGVALAGDREIRARGRH